MVTFPPTALTDIELAFGAVVGMHADVPPIGPFEFPDETPREAFRAVILQAILRGPCFVAFSGGRDSSTVMAVAVDVAREAGIPPPVPIIKFMPGLPDSNETEWQELVLGHLGVKDRIVVTCTAEGDEIFGSDGLEALERVGVAFPPNASSLLGVIRAASGGTLLTGRGGDELGAAAMSRWAARALKDGNAGRRTRVAARLPRLSFGFRYLRAVAVPSTDALFVSPWLTNRGAFALARRQANESATEPLRWDDLLTKHLSRTRYKTLGEQTVATLARPYGVAMEHPLWDRRVLAALARDHSFEGFPSRAAILEQLLAGLLPYELTRRTTKADFSATPWGPEAESFIASWRGGRVPRRYVDPDVLRQEWQLPVGQRSVTGIPLLHSEWLDAHGVSQSATA